MAKTEVSSLIACTRCGAKRGRGKYAVLSARGNDPDCGGYIREVPEEEADQMLAAYLARASKP